MSQLMSDSKSSTQSIILHNGTAMLITDGAQLSKTQSVAVSARRKRMAANIFPAEVSTYIRLK